MSVHIEVTPTTDLKYSIKFLPSASSPALSRVVPLTHARVVLCCCWGGGGGGSRGAEGALGGGGGGE